MQCPECHVDLPDRDLLERDLDDIKLAKVALEERLSYIMEKYNGVIQLLSAHELAEEESGE